MYHYTLNLLCFQNNGIDVVECVSTQHCTPNAWWEGHCNHIILIWYASDWYTYAIIYFWQNERTVCYVFYVVFYVAMTHCELETYYLPSHMISFLATGIPKHQIVLMVDGVFNNTCSTWRKFQAICCSFCCFLFLFK